MWTDHDRVLARALGASDGGPGRFSRVTRLIDAEGRVLVAYDVGLSIPTHPQDVLEDCQALFGAGVSP